MSNKASQSAQLASKSTSASDSKAMTDENQQPPAAQSDAATAADDAQPAAKKQKTATGTTAAAGAKSATSASTSSAAAAAPASLEEIKQSKATQLTFDLNEVCLAHNRDMLYEAKIIKREQRQAKMQYFVHYNGWNKSHDEWLSHDKLLKKTPESELLAKKMADEIKRIQQEQKLRKSKGGAGSGLKDAKGCVSRAKGKDGVKSVDLTIDLDADSDKANKIVIPQHLKKQLILDWESITRKQMLVPLPREPCIDQLLDQYCAEQTSDAARHLQTEICSGLKTYFNRALPTVLLYRFERPQWKAMIEKHKDWALTRIYGSEHLLRLFVKLPSLLTHTQMTEQENNLLRRQMEQLLLWMDKQAQMPANASSQLKKDANQTNSNNAVKPEQKSTNKFFLQELMPTDSSYVALVEQ